MTNEATALTDPEQIESDGLVEQFEFAWLIEFPESGESFRDGKCVGPATPIQWFCAIPRGDRVIRRTSEAFEAVRFSRRSDAEAMLTILDDDSEHSVGVKSGGYVCEHGFLTTVRRNTRLITDAATIARLREALAYYADDKGGMPNDGPWGVASDDFGQRARAALTPASGEVE